MKGLLDAVNVVSCHPTWGFTKPDVVGDDHRGWMFTEDRADPLGHATVRDIYEKTNAVFTKPTVPILFDKKTSSVVNNESAEKKKWGRGALILLKILANLSRQIKNNIKSQMKNKIKLTRNN